MPILTDSHMHTHFSTDSEAPMEEMIVSAIQKGLTNICFTDHQDFDYPDMPDLPEGAFMLDVDSYRKEWNSLRDRYEGEKVSLPDGTTAPFHLRFGVECGMQKCCADKNSQLVSAHPFDFVIASQHLCGGMDAYYPEFHQLYPDTAAIFHQYLEETYENIQAFPNFDSLGHLDYMIRYCTSIGQTYDMKNEEEIIRAILEYLIKKDKALEVNSASYRKGMSEPNPRREVLSIYKEMGGKLLTIGSDAHNPHDIAADFNRVSDLLTSIGFQEYVLYEKHTPVSLPL